MANTKQIPRAEWKAYFERLTRSFLADDSPETASVEILSPRLGDQIEAETARLLGIVYDPKSNALEVWLEDLDHLSFEPTEIWVVEEEGGFVPAMEVKLADGDVEILHIHRTGPLARRHEPSISTPRG